MQPTQLKKFQSLDYSAKGQTNSTKVLTGAGGDLESQAAGPRDASMTKSSGTKDNQRPPLMHSISIVVELAKEVQQHHQLSQSAALSSCGSSANSNDDTTTSEPAGCGAGGLPLHKGPAAEEELDDGEMEEELELRHQGPRNLDEEEEEEEEDDEEEEVDSCLSSGLARRLMLVDEADKKFLRNRAQSAEPQMLRLQLASLQAFNLAGNRCDSLSPTGRPPAQQPAPFAYVHSGNLASIHHTDRPEAAGAPKPSQLRPRLSLASGSPLGSPNSRVVSPSGHQHNFSSGELAECGKLSMRRNTHHHVNFGLSSMVSPSDGDSAHLHQEPARNTPQDVNNQRSPLATAEAIQHQRQQALVVRTSAQKPPTSPNKATASTSSDLASETRSFRSPSLAVGAIQQQQQQQRAFQFHQSHQQHLNQTGPILNQHRRQSLQISLLSGLANRADSSRSLTEEELRGEREFNEQVRSAARSPRELARHTTNQQQLRNFSLTRSSNLFECGPGGLSPDFASKFRRDEEETRSKSTGVDFNNLVVDLKGAGEAELRSASSSLRSRRRVSFGSIDPIQLSHSSAFGGRAGSAFSQRSPEASTSTKTTSNNKKRASICCPSPALSHHLIGHPSPTAISSGILRKLEKISAANACKPSPSDTSTTTQQHLSPGARIMNAKRDNEENDKTLARASQSETTASTKTSALRASEGLTSQPPSRMADDNQQQQPSPEEACSRDESEIANNNHNAKQQQQQQQQQQQLQQHETLGRVHLRRGRQASVGGEAAAAASANGMASSAGLMTAASVDLGETVPVTPTASGAAPSRRLPSRSISGTAAMEKDDSRVQSIMANAKLRQEEFARLLEEHEQIVNEINRFEIKISTSSAAAAAKQQKSEQH